MVMGASPELGRLLRVVEVVRRVVGDETLAQQQAALTDATPPPPASHRRQSAPRQIVAVGAED